MEEEEPDLQEPDYDLIKGSPIFHQDSKFILDLENQVGYFWADDEYNLHHSHVLDMIAEIGEGDVQNMALGYIDLGQNPEIFSDKDEQEERDLNWFSEIFAPKREILRGDKTYTLKQTPLKISEMVKTSDEIEGSVPVGDVCKFISFPNKDVFGVKILRIILNTPQIWI